MGLFGWNDNVRKHFAINNNIRLQSIEGNLISLQIMFLEKEKYIMGMTSAEEYKKWLSSIDKPTWGKLDLYMKTMEGTNNA